uniref:DNA helicase Pif1-like 2B domain-containing protein n=1 Tax=Caenorhabditis japonica TaxID=281687 RepID=A0A8R1DIK9_CAEJA
MFLRNLDVSSGMGNGTRLIINKLKRKCVLCLFAIESNNTLVQNISCYKDKKLLFRLKRTQFPCRVMYPFMI